MLVGHVVNIDLDDRCKAFISLGFISMQILDPTWRNLYSQKNFDFHPLET